MLVAPRSRTFMRAFLDWFPAARATLNIASLVSPFFPNRDQGNCRIVRCIFMAPRVRELLNAPVATDLPPFHISVVLRRISRFPSRQSRFHDAIVAASSSPRVFLPAASNNRCVARTRRLLRVRGETGEDEYSEFPGRAETHLISRRVPEARGVCKYPRINPPFGHNESN